MAIVGGESGPAHVVPQRFMFVRPHLFQPAANMSTVGLGTCARGPGPSWRLGALALAWLRVTKTHACAWGLRGELQNDVSGVDRRGNRTTPTAKTIMNKGEVGGVRTRALGTAQGPLLWTPDGFRGN